MSAPHDDIPAATARPLLAYESPSQVQLVVLRRFAPFEAELARAKLADAGIDALITDANVAATHPLLFHEVRLFVQRRDVDRARAVLDEPAPAIPGDLDDDDEYVDEPWRCPRCRKKQIELLALRSPFREMKFALVLVIVLPPVFALVSSFFGDDSAGTRTSGDLGSALFLIWLATVAGLAIALIFAKRDKRCAACGNEWR